MPYELIFEGKTKKDKKIIIRYPNILDVQVMHHYINTLSKEKTYIRFQGEEVTFEEEKDYLDAQLQKISQNKAIMLLSFCNGELVGIAGIDMFDKTEKHVGLFGISISKNFREEGIGSLLMQLTISEAVKNIPFLEIVTLCVFSNNKIGLEMYKKQGFLEYGRLPKGVKLEGGYVDHVMMYKNVVKKI
jgi:RimJ/RimL family protein N-acetyltransferase